MKGHNRDMCDLCMLNSPVNPSTCCPFVICTKWAVKAWEQVIESLVRNTLITGDCKRHEDLQNASSSNAIAQTEIIEHKRNRVVS